MAKEYTVLKVTPMSRVADEGGIEKYYRIKYKTEGGIVDTFDVPEKEYTAKDLPPIILKLAQKHDAMLLL